MLRSLMFVIPILVVSNAHAGSIAAVEAPATVQSMVRKLTPKVTWPPPASITYGTPLGAGELNATADVPGTFAYSPAPGAVLKAGPNQPLTVVFTPADNQYEPVSAVTVLTVNKAPALISLAGLSQPYDGLPKDVVATTMPGHLKVVIAYGSGLDGPIFPGRYAVAAAIDDPNYAGIATDTLTVTITALVRHAPAVSGAVDGSIQVALGEDVIFDDNAWLSGDLLVTGTPSLQLNGLPMIAGTVDANGPATPDNYAIVLTGNSVIRYLIRRVNGGLFPAVSAPAPVLATRSVVLSAPSESPGDFNTLRDLTLANNAGAVRVPAGSYGQLTANRNAELILGRSGTTQPDVYHLQGLVLNRGGRVRVAGPVLIILAKGTVIEGTMGDATHAPWLTVAVADGDVTLAPNATFGGFVLAPHGHVTISEGAELTGEVISDRLTILSGGELAEPAS